MLFGSSTRGLHATTHMSAFFQKITLNASCNVHDDLGWKNQTTRYILLWHWLYEWFSQFHSCGTYSVLSQSHSVDPCPFRWPWVTVKGGAWGAKFFRRISITLVWFDHMVTHEGNSMFLGCQPHPIPRAPASLKLLGTPYLVEGEETAVLWHIHAMWPSGCIADAETNWNERACSDTSVSDFTAVRMLGSPQRWIQADNQQRANILASPLNGEVSTGSVSTPGSWLIDC